MTASTPALEPADIPPLMDGRLRPVADDPVWLEAYLPSPVIQNHAANLMRLGNGELGCAWFGGTMEGMGDISIYFSRLAGGNWSAPRRLTDDPTRSEQNPVLFPAPDGKLWLIYTSQPAGDQDQAIVKRCISTDDGATFGPVSVLCATPSTFVRQPVLINRSGDWLLPIFRCTPTPGQRWRGDHDSAGVLVSADAGANWTLREVPQSLGAVHMNIVPASGDDLLAFYRSRFADFVLTSRSDDAGRHWTAPVPTVLPNNNSSVQAVRLASGRLAIVYNASSAATSTDRRASLYDEIEGDTAPANAPPAGRPAIWGVPRAPLVVALSNDDGLTFPFRRTLETGSGYCLSNNSREGLNREFSYPSLRPGPASTIDIAFTYYRRAIKHVRVSEAWVLGADA